MLSKPCVLEVHTDVIIVKFVSFFQIVSDTIGEDDPQKKRPLGIFTEIPS